MNIAMPEIPKDRLRINVNDSVDLKYWAKRLGVSEKELRDTVERIGPAADAVAEYLGK
ncbi:MAG: DUF3606 domain-containing protein [Chthoniobacterales bacterium]